MKGSDYFCYARHLFDVATMPVASHKKKQELPVGLIPFAYPNEESGFFWHRTLLQHLMSQALQTGRAA
ncbi:hypothetical protein [Rahnella selenatireducens]|uniref:hypothetical protein n=1 Tax=Rahnella selenatireducens TaxID=3389797 RepID=UPI0039693803